MSSIDEKFLISISRVKNILFRDLENIFRENGLTGTQFSVLEVLLHKGDISVGQIQKLILGTSGNIPFVVKNLQRDGLVHRQKNNKDGRVSIISLTAEGRRIVEKVYIVQKNRLEFLLEDIDSEKKSYLTEEIFSIFNSIKNKTDKKI